MTSLKLEIHQCVYMYVLVNIYTFVYYVVERIFFPVIKYHFYPKEKIDHNLHSYITLKGMARRKDLI